MDLDKTEFAPRVAPICSCVLVAQNLRATRIAPMFRPVVIEKILCISVENKVPFALIKFAHTSSFFVNVAEWRRAGQGQNWSLHLDLGESSFLF